MVEKGKKRVVLGVLGCETNHVSSNYLHKISTLDDVRGMYPQIVGEDTNIKLAVLSLVSRLNLNKDFWIMGLIVQGESSGGKSYFTSQVVKPWKLLNRVEEFTRFTGAYLERKFAGRNMDDIILLIYELPQDTPQQLHLTMSEGRLRVGIIDKELGEPVEHTFEGMPFLFSTTPLEGLRPDIRNRVITTTIDETETQTRRILRFESWLASDSAFSTSLSETADTQAERLASHIAGLKKAYVSIPFAHRLYDYISFYNTKLRRDWKKLLALIQASAILFQESRRVVERDGVRTIIADVRDLENLIDVMPAFSQTLTNLSQAQYRVVEIMREGRGAGLRASSSMRLGSADGT
jgi:hypothetical protein